MTEKLIIAVPKGRILEELIPLLERADIVPESEFFNKNTRLLQFKTNHENLELVRVRSFDVPSFVAFGGVALGVTGSDVLAEFGSGEIYAPLKLGIGKCRMSIAATKDIAENEDISRWSHIRVATKYPNTTGRYFSARGIQAECIKLNGAMELAPKLGLCRRIVDLVSSGRTLQENGLVEIEKIADVESELIVNRTIFKTKTNQINDIIRRVREAITND